MKIKEFKTELKRAKLLDTNPNFSYSYTSGVYFKYDIEKYCKIHKPNNFPFSNPILIFDINKIRKDKVYDIPKNVKKLELDLGSGGILIYNILEDTRQGGYDGFRTLTNFK